VPFRVIAFVPVPEILNGDVPPIFKTGFELPIIKVEVFPPLAFTVVIDPLTVNVPLA
jgi:hypothetical protein